MYEALGELGPAAKSASDALCRAMLDTSKLVRGKADIALKKVCPALYPHVVTLLADGDNVNHLVAVEAIREMKEESKPAKWILLRHLELEVGHLRGLNQAQLEVKRKALFVRQA